ncbi:MAG: toprim domain-containing protein [Arcobacter sp.]|nr:toprim domain-containing protein [Arcobacter sp.]
MIIQIDSEKNGWVEYVLNGSKDKPRDKKLIEKIDGDFELTKKIYQSTDSKNTYNKIVISFDGKIDNETIKKVYQDFKKEFLVGFEEDEVNTAAVIHQDTENSHVHICIPKLNLKTKIINDYYYDKMDRNRVNLIKYSLINKYNLTLPQNKKIDIEVKDEDKKLKIIKIWRKIHGQRPISLKKDRGKKRAKEEIGKYIEELYQTGLINNQKEIIEIFKEIDISIEIVRVANWDGVDSITIKDKNNIKMKLEGAIYGEFYKPTRKDTKTQREDNKHNKGLSSRIRNSSIRNIQEFGRTREERARNLQQKLDAENEKRISKVSKKLAKSRERARDKDNNLYKPIYFSFLDGNVFNNNKGFSNKPSRIKKSKWRNLLGIRLKQSWIQLLTRRKHINLLEKKGREVDGRIVEQMERYSKFMAETKAEMDERTGKVISRSKQVRFGVEELQEGTRKLKSRVGGMKMKNNTELENFKKSDLIDFVVLLGGELDEQKSCTSAAVVNFNNRKLIISKNTNAHHIFFDTETGQGGTIIDFYKQYLQKEKREPFWKSLLGIRNIYKNGVPSNNFQLKEITQEEIENIQATQQKLNNLKSLTTHSSYLKNRGIDLNTQNAFNSIVKVDYNDNLCFVNKSFQDGKFINCGAINQETKKIFGNKGISGAVIGNNPKTARENIYLFESNLDAMSFYQLHKLEGTYLSLGGNVSKKQLEDLIQVLKLQNGKNVNFCLDNDDGGEKIKKEITQHIFPYCNAESIELEQIKPENKDFNEDLQQSKTMQKGMGI